MLTPCPRPTRRRPAHLGTAAGLAAALLLAAPAARAADPAVKLCVAGCKEAAAACKEATASAGDAATAACASDPATERVCLDVAKRVTKASKKSCKGAQKACKRCCKQGGKACEIPPELPQLTGTFGAPDRTALEQLPLPPFPNGRGVVMVRLRDGDFGFDPEARTPVSAAAECAAAMLDCYDEALRNVPGCFAAVPTCRSATPWKGQGPMCCAARCGERYQELLRAGRPVPLAFSGAIWDAPSCMPGLEGRPTEGTP